jgi:cystathionine beta-lyase/cystathionine gamma-synthase
MAAISCAVFSCVGAGGRMVAMGDVYGGTYSLLSQQVPAMGVDVSFVRSNEASALVDACDEDTRLVYVETPTNPFNRIVDLKALVDALERRFGDRRPPVVCDATFASPFNLRPIESGVDVVVHSATKYLNGHSDVIAGVASGSAARVAAMVPWMRNLGASIDPHQAFLVARGMRTLPLRMRAHHENAQAVARLLDGHAAVERVWYPGLAGHPDHDLARRTMSGYGGIVSFQPVTRDPVAARAFIESLRLFQAAASLGGVESLATLPAETSHSYLSPKELEAAGLSPTFVRLAVGVEDAKDIEADLRRALEAFA